MQEKLKESDNRKKEVRVKEAINSTKIFRTETETSRDRKKRTLRKKKRHSESSSHVVQNVDTMSPRATEVSLVTVLIQ